MISLFNPIRGVDALSVVIRMLFSMLCGAAVGLERSYKNRPAGFRTHILVCAGAATASLTGVYLYAGLHYATDITRIGAQVITGLGFIGAGTIVVTRKYKVIGLTTAAGLWTTGIIGLAVGMGFYEGALIATALVLITEIFFTRLAQRIYHAPEFTLAIEYRERDALSEMIRFCKDNRMAVTNLNVIVLESESDAHLYKAMISLRPMRNADSEQFVGKMRDSQRIVSLKIVE